jgi:alkylhydroperoxidase/carboxymuconolactone decarboxylase family protein YurZ
MRKDGCAWTTRSGCGASPSATPAFCNDGVDWVGGEHEGLDAKALALVRLAALVAVGGAEPSYGAHADGAVDAGATVVEIVVAGAHSVMWPTGLSPTLL